MTLPVDNTAVAKEIGPRAQPSGRGRSRAPAMVETRPGGDTQTQWGYSQSWRGHTQTHTQVQQGHTQWPSLGADGHEEWVSQSPAGCEWSKLTLKLLAVLQTLSSHQERKYYRSC